MFQHNIQAVWFCRGDLIELHPELILYALKKNFVIGNHAFNHISFSDLSLHDCYEEIKSTDQLLSDLHKEAGIAWENKLFRFPYGDKGDLNKGLLKKVSRKGKIRKEEIQQMLKSLDYIQPNWEGVKYDFFSSHGLAEDTDCSWTFDVMEWSTHINKPVFGIDNLNQVLKRLDEKNPRDCRFKLREERGLANLASNEIILLHRSC